MIVDFSARPYDVKSASNTHPRIELDLKTQIDPILPIDHLAERAVEQAIQLLDALDRYRLAQYDLEHEHARHERHAPSRVVEEGVV